jgi:hypothetical protein
MLNFIAWLTGGGRSYLKKAPPRDEIKSYKKRLRKVMPPGKVKHSLRVGAALAGMGENPKTVRAGVFHDYTERGGDIDKIKGVDCHLVKAVTGEKIAVKKKVNAPLEHMKHILTHPSMTPEMKNAVVKLKLTDRLDNVGRRKQASDDYLKKSRQVVKYVVKHYSGDHGKIHPVLKKFKEAGVDVGKKHIGTLVR